MSAEENPVVGQDFQLNMTAKDKDGNLIDLSGATITIKYKKPLGDCQSGIVPDDIDIPTSVVTYDIPAAIADEAGTWYFNVEVTKLGKKTISSPATEVEYDADIC